MGRKYYVMSFGLGGNGAEGMDGEQPFHSSWYIRPDELQRYICNNHYKPEEMEGCWLIDKIAVLEKDPFLAYKSPMVNLKESSRFKDIKVDPVFGNAVFKGFGAVGTCAKIAQADDKFEGMDYVSVEYYINWWKDKGARIGQVLNGKVVWYEE